MVKVQFTKITVWINRYVSGLGNQKALNETYQKLLRKVRS